jgi:PKD repeat protein
MGCFEDSGTKKNKSPTADAGEDIEVLSMTEIQFDGSGSKDPDGKIAEYEWDFADPKGSGKDYSSDPEPKYTYNYPGEYEATLTVTDDDGASDTTSIIVTILNRKPVVDVGSDITVNVFEIVYFNITADDLDGYIRSFEWDFDGDEDTDWFAASTGTTTHFYESTGTYQAGLTVSDNSDEEITVYRNITVVEVIKIPPVADAGLDQTVAVGDVLLKGTGSDPDGSIILYEWDFDGDGTFDWSSSNTGIVKNIYTDEGLFNAKFKVTDDSGLTASDNVKITVNNSIIAHNVEAEIFVDWNTTNNYIIVLNTTINTSELTVIIDDVVTSQQEDFLISELEELSPTRFMATSNIIPIPGHALQVQVFYYQTLISARVIDVVNQSYEFISPDLDFKAFYDIDELLEEHDRSEIETLRITSIGELEIEKIGELYHTSLHGEGVYYTYDETEDTQTEITVNCTDLWLNLTLQGSEIISRSISLLGYGTMIADYGEELSMDLDITKMKVVTENNVDIENYVIGDGTFTGTTTEPSTGLDLELSGDVYFLTELIGHGTQKNYENEEYSCSIMYSLVILDGIGKLQGTGPAITIQSIVENTTWNADYEKYTNNTIYYEYNLTSIVSNIEYTDQGYGYPENSPELKKPETHIIDALTFDSPRARVLIGEDLIVLESKHGVKLKLTVLGELDHVVNNKKYECVDVKGSFIAGATGFVKIRMIRSGTFAGMAVNNEQDIRWKGEIVTSTVNLKYIV